MSDLSGKVVVVTGAARGIGRAIALSAAAQGACVVVADFGGALEALADGSEAPARQVVDEIRAAGGEGIACDESVATMAGGAAIVAAAVTRYGRLDGLVCCAGLLTQKHLWDMTESEWDDVIGSHLKGHFSCTQAAARVMMPRRSGSIVHFSSASALVTPPHQPSYSAAKAGIMGFSRSCALDLAPYDIRVNCIMPGASTRMTDAVYSYYGVQDSGQVETKGAGARLTAAVALTSDQAAGTWRDPARVAPFATFLLGERSEGVSGQTFAVVGDQVTHVRERTYGTTMRNDFGAPTDALADKFDRELRPELELRQFDWPPP